MTFHSVANSLYQTNVLETSSKSTKLIHGGLRYLQQVLQIRDGFSAMKEKLYLVSQALKQRDFMLNSAAYLNKPIQILVPIQSDSMIQSAYMLGGVKAYHLIYKLFQDRKMFSNQIDLSSPRRMIAEEIYQKFPYFKKSRALSRSLSGVTITQGQMIDSRMCLISILTALERSQSLALNYAQVTEFKWNQQKQKIAGIKVRDKLSNQSYQINAKNVINCTGVFSDKIRKLANPSLHNRILAAKGTHLVLNIPFCQEGMGMIVPKTKDGRLLFVLPFHGADNQLYTLLGTTDDYSQVQSDVQSTQQQIEYLLGQFQEYIDTASIGNLKDKVVASWAGLRPLVLTQSAAKLGEMKSKSVSRCHVVQRDQKSGLISLMGGKWTTYRQMGEDVIKEICDNKIEKSRSNKGIELVGNFRNTIQEVQLQQNLRRSIKSDDEDLKSKLVADLINRYGGRSKNILRYSDDGCLNVISVQGSEFKITREEVLYLMKQEMAVNQHDIVDRRLGLSFFDQRLNLQWKGLIREILQSINERIA